MNLWQWHHMATQNWINIATGNGLMSDGTTPLPEPMFIYQQLDPVIFTWGQSQERYPSDQSLKLVWKINWKSAIQISQGPIS